MSASHDHGADAVSGADLVERLGRSTGFRFLSQALSDVLVVLDPEERIVFAGEGADRMFGLDAERLIGRPFRHFLDSDDLNGLPPLIREDGGPWETRLGEDEDRGWVSIAARDAGRLSTPDANGDLLEHLQGHVLLFVRPIGRRRVARDRLDLFREAIDATNNLLVIADARQEDNPIVFVNGNFLDITGYTREEVVGRNCRFLQVRPDGTRDDDQDGVRRLHEAIRDGKDAHVLIRNYRKDGTLFWNELFITPIRDAEGEVTHFVGIQNDVTDRIEAERGRDERQDMLNAFYNSSPLLMGVVEVGDDDIVIRSANARSEMPYGDAPGALEGKSLEALGRSDVDRAFWNNLFRSAMKAGETARTTTPLPVHSPDAGDPRWFDVTVSPIGGTEDRLALFVISEITEQRRILQQQADLTTALDNASDAVVITDAQLNVPGPSILYVNRAFEEMSGYSREESLGRNPRFMQGPLTSRVELDRLRRCLEAGEQYSGELINYTKDGKPYVVEVEIAPVRDEEGTIQRFVSTQRDVTQRRRLEREVLQATASAQAHIARDLHDGLGQVLTGTAFHIHGIVQRLQSEDPALLREATRAAELVQAAQDQTRALAHSLFPVTAQGEAFFDALAQLAADAADAYAIECTFETDLEQPIETVETTGHLYRIAQEALTNAVRHGQPSTVRVCLSRVSTRDGGKPQGLLTIADDGVGISASDGDGMGLSTMRYRARQIGGAFSVDSGDVGGTVVRVQFPLGGAAESDIYRD